MGDIGEESLLCFKHVNSAIRRASDYKSEPSNWIDLSVVMLKCDLLFPWSLSALSSEILQGTF